MLTLYREQVTATRDAKSDLDPREDELAWGERSAFGSRRGLPWWGAVLVALVPAAVGVLIDIERAKQLGFVFQGLYFLGCVAAVCLVQRRAIFGPMVQPPLILAITLPAVILATAAPSSGGLTSKALVVGTPLINGFPTMAVTTGITLLIGLIRVFTQRKPQEPEPSTARRTPRQSSGKSASGRPQAARKADGSGQSSAAGRTDGPKRTGTAGRGGAGREAASGRSAGGQAGRPAAGQPAAQNRQQSGARQPGRPAGEAPRRPAPPRRPEPPRRTGRGYDDDR